MTKHIIIADTAFIRTWKDNGFTMLLCAHVGAETTLSLTDDHVRQLVEAIQVAPVPNPTGEALYKAGIAKGRDDLDEMGEVAHASLPDALRMFDRWIADAMPANDKGQAPFGRALAESLADAVRAHLKLESGK